MSEYRPNLGSWAPLSWDWGISNQTPILLWTWCLQHAITLLASQNNSLVVMLNRAGEDTHKWSLSLQYQGPIFGTGVTLPSSYLPQVCSKYAHCIGRWFPDPVERHSHACFLFLFFLWIQTTFLDSSLVVVPCSWQSVTFFYKFD